MGNYKNVGNYKPSGSSNTYARVVKKTTENVTSSTTLQDDDELKVTLVENKKYYFDLTLFINSISANGEFKFAFTHPSGSTGERSDDTLRGDLIFTSVTLVTVKSITMPTNIARCMKFIGKVIMSSTPGDLQLQWAQNASDASASQVLEGSSLVVYEEK